MFFLFFVREEQAADFWGKSSRTIRDRADSD
jgi:hypothetical protein